MMYVPNLMDGGAMLMTGSLSLTMIRRCGNTMRDDWVSMSVTRGRIWLLLLVKKRSGSDFMFLQVRTAGSIAPTVDSFKTVDDFTILKSRRHAYMHPYARKYCTLTGGKGVRGLDDRPAYSTQMEQYVGSLIRVSVDYKGSQERDDLPGVVKRQKRTKK